uniref:Major facilitator superfamily (MFS) profile domain-containing protein n=1 Tax=Oryza rufipogon TaxID=4529 RepID=A0A0E0Q3P4_ORYRU
MAAQLGDDGELSQASALLLIVLVAVYVAGFAWSWGPLGWLVPSEIFPLEVRSAGQSIAVAVNFLLTTAVAQSFLAMLCHMKAGIFFFFAAWLVAMTAFVYLLLPETKGLPIEQVGKLWARHWFWRRFVMTGINAIAFYAPVLLRTVGMGESAALLAVVIKQVVGIGATLASMLAVDRFGRRTLFLAGGAQMVISQLLIGAIMAAQLGDDGELSQASALLLIVLVAS